MPGYNSIERADNHIDHDSTTGNFGYLFDLPIYGYYYYKKHCGSRDNNLTFALYFTNTLFRETETNQWPSADELRGFKRVPEIPLTDDMKNVQIIPVERSDYQCDNPDVVDASFFKRLFSRRSTSTMNTRMARDGNTSMLYKVTFDIPFDAIAHHVTVEKTLRHEGTQQKKTLYNPAPSLDNPVEELFKELNMVRSHIDTMQRIARYIKTNPDTFKRVPHPIDPSYSIRYQQQCRDFDENYRSQYNIELVELMIQKVQNAVRDMSESIWHARYADIVSELEELKKPKKCRHEKCQRFAVLGSPYCGQCIKRMHPSECSCCGTEKSTPWDEADVSCRSDHCE